MAKQVGSSLTGSFDGLSFYHDRLHGYLVRSTGGVTSKKYRSDPRYAAARDASSEFTGVSRAGKLIRNALGEFIVRVKDGTMVNRLNRELVALKQLDHVHVRGRRRPETVMGILNADRNFRAFQFNACVKTCDILRNSPEVVRNGAVPGLNNIALKGNAFPPGATHAGLTLVRTVINFEIGTFETSTSDMALCSPDSHETSLLITDLPTMTGIELLCLQVVFFREVDGDLMQLKGKVNGMGVLAVEQVKETVPEKRLSGIHVHNICSSGKLVPAGFQDVESSNFPFSSCFFRNYFNRVVLRAP